MINERCLKLLVIWPFVYMWVSTFFFSSRRRHTRSKRGWSSDVCSSDLRHRQRPDSLTGRVVKSVRDRGGGGDVGGFRDAARIGGRVRSDLFEDVHVDLGCFERSRHLVRSEERRVGKEGSLRWGMDV